MPVTPITDFGTALITGVAAALATFFAALPSVIGAILILVIGWIIAGWIGGLVAKALRAIRFDMFQNVNIENRIEFIGCGYIGNGADCRRAAFWQLTSLDLAIYDFSETRIRFETNPMLLAAVAKGLRRRANSGAHFQDIPANVFGDEASVIGFPIRCERKNIKFRSDVGKICHLPEYTVLFRKIKGR